jgi:flagellar L-ring protein precursor FlgH
MKHLVPLLLASMLAACGSRQHVAHEPRNREYDTGSYETAPAPISDGSAWLDSNRGLFADFRASRVGDIVTIRIDETVNASGDASTSMDRDSRESFGLPSFFGLTNALQRSYPDIDPDELLSFVAGKRFRGDGETRRGSRARGVLAVRVKKMLPNGDLFVEGTKIIKINDEELRIYISGVIRPEDIEQDNAIRSALVADAEIEFSGHGALTENQQQGWLANLIAKIRPF